MLYTHVHVSFFKGYLIILFLISCYTCMLVVCYYSDPYVNCEEVQTLFCQHGMYDDALRLSENCKLSLVPIYESLATK